MPARSGRSVALLSVLMLASTACAGGGATAGAVRYLSGADATTRFGTDHGSGAILVTTVSR